ncbi:OsmC family protein [Aquirhabdus sp.]|uniref:OsmC family protein n=1 Tax=Aquirhabdus sp. TaxID=2824160 RepID=UPI00396CEE82
MSLRDIISNTTSTLSKNPNAAKATFDASHALVGVTEVSVRVGSGHKFTIDEPEVLGGQNHGANPVEHALAALGSCQAITYRIWATKLGIQINKVEVSVEGDIDLRGFFGVDENVRPGFNAIRIQVRLSGPETQDRYAKLTAAVNAHCPVLDLFANQVPIEHHLISDVQLQ